jgi:hypothetical protein
MSQYYGFYTNKDNHENENENKNYTTLIEDVKNNNIDNIIFNIDSIKISLLKHYIKIYNPNLLLGYSPPIILILYLITHK